MTAGPGRLNLAGGEIEYRPIGGDQGAPVPLVFLHEGLGSAGLWRDFPDKVCAAAGRAGLVWSRHGYGTSEVVDRRRDVGYMHHEALVVLPAILERLGIERAVLVGHSDGASIALIHAGADDSRAAGVVALAPHVFVEDRSVAGIAEARRRYVEGDLRTRLAPHHADVDAAFWGWNDIWLDPSFRAWNIEDRLGSVAVPVLLVQCEDDAYGTLEQLDRIERGVKGPVDRLVLPAGGHAPHLAAPAAVAEAVVRFVRGLP